MCPICGEIIAQTILPAEVQVLVHRWMKHETPAVQLFTVIILTFAGGWVLKKAFTGR